VPVLKIALNPNGGQKARRTERAKYERKKKNKTLKKA